MKKGISLIVLVITIIVIIILAGAVILSLANNNPIAQANIATKSSDADAVQSAISMYVGRIMAEYRAPVVIGLTVANTPQDLKASNIPLKTTDGKLLYRTLADQSIGAYTVAPTPSANYSQITLSTAELGLAGWPTSGGSSALNVDQNGKVVWNP